MSQHQISVDIVSAQVFDSGPDRNGAIVSAFVANVCGEPGFEGFSFRFAERVSCLKIAPFMCLTPDLVFVQSGSSVHGESSPALSR